MMILRADSKQLSYRKQVARQQRTHSNNSKFSGGVFHGGGINICDTVGGRRPSHAISWEIFLQSTSLPSRKQISAIVFKLSCELIHTYTSIPNDSHMHVLHGSRIHFSNISKMIVRWFCGLHIHIKFHWPKLHVMEGTLYHMHCQ